MPPDSADAEPARPHDEAVKDLSRRTTLGAAGLVVSRVLARGIDFVSLLVLARLLAPADFGLVAIAMTLIQIVEAVLELPAIQVLIRLQTPSRAQIDTAFTLSLLRGLLLAAIVAVGAFVLAWVFHDPRLAPITMFLSISPVFRGLQSPNLAIFARRIDFRRDMAMEFSGKLVGLAAALVVAWLHGGYWALAAYSVANPAIMALMSFVMAPYRPRLTLSEWPLFAHILGWSSLAQAVNAINWQSDRLILANFVPLRVLGAYSVANDLSVTPELALVKPVARPVMAAFSLVRDDQERLRRAYARVASGLLAAGLPFVVSLSVLAEPTVRFVLGEKWASVPPILTWLSLALIPVLAFAPLDSLALALHRAETFVIRSTGELLVKLPLTALCAFLFGVSGVVAARLVSSIAVAAISMAVIKQLLGTSCIEQLSRMGRTAGAGCALALFLLLTRGGLTGLSGAQLGLGLALEGGLGLAVYAATHLLLWWLGGRPDDAIEAVVLERLSRAGRSLARA